VRPVSLVTPGPPAPEDVDEDDVDEAIGPASRHRRHQLPGRNRRVLLRLSEAEYDDLARASEGSGLTPTGFAAQAALTAAKGREIPEHGPLRLALVAFMQSRTQLRKVGVNLNQAVAQLNTTGEVHAAMERIVERVEEAVARNDAAAETLAAILLRGRR
jgi:hypothetical protein